MKKSFAARFEQNTVHRTHSDCLQKDRDRSRKTPHWEDNHMCEMQTGI